MRPLFITREYELSQLAAVLDWVLVAVGSTLPSHRRQGRKGLSWPRIRDGLTGEGGTEWEGGDTHEIIDQALHALETYLAEMMDVFRKVGIMVSLTISAW